MSIELILTALNKRLDIKRTGLSYKGRMEKF